MRKFGFAGLGLVIALFAVPGAFAAGQQEEKEKLVIWDNQTANGTMKEMIDIAAEQFTKDTGVEVEVVHIESDNYKTKINIALNSYPPDIYHNWGGGGLKSQVDAGLVEPITEIADQMKTRFIPSSFDHMTFDDQVYGVSYSGMASVYFWYRKDIFNKYGLTEPKTWTEFENVCDTLKANDITPIVLPNKPKWPGSFFYMYLVDRIGGPNLFSEALYGGERTFNDPAFVEAAALAQDMVNKGYFVEGMNSIDWSSGDSRILLYTGKASMILMGNWITGNFPKEAPELVDQFGFFPFPAVDGGLGNPANLVGSPGQDNFSISSKSDHKDLAKKFLSEYVMNDEWIEYCISIGRIPPIQNISKQIERPDYKKIAQYMEQAPSIQLYYDQFLGADEAESHKSIVQEMFSLTITPEDVAQKHFDSIIK